MGGAVNHLEGYALTARLTNKIKYPYLLLLASGGHSKMMNLGFPGGPEIEKKSNVR